MTHASPANSLTTPAITVEGALIAPAMLARIAAQKAESQSDSDYRVLKGLTLRDEIARYFRIGQALFAEFTASAAPSTARTIGFVEALFRDVFGFPDMSRAGKQNVEGRVYNVTLEGLQGRIPIVLVPPSDSLDRASDQLAADGQQQAAAA